MNVSEWFYHYKLSRPYTVVVINEYHGSAVPAGVKGRRKYKEENIDDISQSKTNAFEIMNVYFHIYYKLAVARLR